MSKHYTPEKLEMCFMQETTRELETINNLVENQTERRRVVEKSEDIGENIIGDSSDRTSKAFPSSKHSSSSAKVICLNHLVFLVLALSVLSSIHAV